MYFDLINFVEVNYYHFHLVFLLQISTSFGVSFWVFLAKQGFVHVRSDRQAK